MNNCPVCCSNASAKLDEISLAAVCKYYQDSLSIDVSNLLKNGGPPIQLRHCGKCDLRWFAPAPSGDPQFYERLQKHDWYYQDDKPEFFHAIKYVKSGDNILEVGCGKGALAVHLPSGVSYRGLEFNQDAVDKGRAAGLRIDMDPVDFHATKHPSAYDVVCHFQVLEHVTHPLAFLTACTALMKPGGLLVVAVPSEDSFLSIVEGGFLNMPPHHLTRWTDSALGFAMKEVGLKPIEIWHAATISRR